MLSRQIGPAHVRDLEPWHADELAGFFQRSGADLYEWLPWAHFESTDATKKFLKGFADGTLRQVFRVREDFHDLEVWSLLRDEWRA
jgi:hypothetical protein